MCPWALSTAAFSRKFHGLNSWTNNIELIIMVKTGASKTRTWHDSKRIMKKCKDLISNWYINKIRSWHIFNMGHGTDRIELHDWHWAFRSTTCWITRNASLKAKLHYASWFGAGSKLVQSWFGAGPKQVWSWFELKFGLSSSLLAAN